MQRPTTSSTRPVLALAASLILVATGCGAAADKVAEKATEKAIESQTGGDVDINTSDDGSVSIETEEGSFSTGMGSIPDEWPEEVPLPEDLEVQAGTTLDSSDGRLVSVMGNTPEDPEAILEELKAALADWSISGEVTSTGGGSTMTSAQWDTDGRRVTFVASTLLEGGTSLTIGHTTLD